MAAKAIGRGLWLLGGMASVGIGLIWGFLGFMTAGLGISGSGCSHQCMSRVSFLAFMGRLFLGPAIGAAIVSIGVTWVNQSPPLKVWISVGMTALNAYVVLLAGAAFAFLTGF